MRKRLLRWSRHVCPVLPATTLVQYDMPCKCGWRVTGVLYADTDAELMARIGAPIRKQDLGGPLHAFLTHYDACPSRAQEAS